MGLFEAYKRWRHTRGYGVHSPFAYTVLTEVITMPHAYYGYAAVDRLMKPSTRHSLTARRSRLALRLAAFLRPDSVCVTDGSARLLHTALRQGRPSAKFYSPKAASKARLVVSPNGDADEAVLAERIRCGAAILAFGIGEASSRRLIDAMTEGVGFVSPDSLLLIPRPQTAKAVYTLNF